jgi:anti-sigma B factor antagonist
MGRSARQELSLFRIDVYPQGEVVRVVPAGELDLATAGELEAQPQELRGFEHVVLDLRKLTFLDSTGIRLIFSEDRSARSSGRDFSLINGPPAVQRVLDICGLSDQLRFTSSPAIAPSGRSASGLRHAPRRGSDLGIAFQRYVAELRHQARPIRKLTSAANRSV